MYSDYRLDTPPPNSRFRRPWSPDPHDPFPSARQNQTSRRESSDVSVEALDLADYARTLRRNPISQPHFRPNDPYLHSPQAIRPFSQESLHSPSLMSPGGTLSTASSSRSPALRPYSLPPLSEVPHSFNHGYSPQNETAMPGDYRSPHPQQDQETEVDIGNFPAFSRHWYKDHRPLSQSPPNPYQSIPRDEGFSPFDPSFPTHNYHSSDKIALSEPGYPLSSESHSRTVLPWANEAQDQSMAVHDEVKQERLRMLEREFAGIGKPGNTEDDNLIGSADQRGRLITEGPKKRLANRWLQVILTSGAAISVIYASVVTKPKGTPPPQGKTPIYILYVLSVVTFLFVVYIFLIYPSCCLGRGKQSPNFTGPTGGPGGLAVLPVQHFPGGSKHKGGKKKGKKGKKGMTGMGGDVQVNLIVDPTMFGGGRGFDEDDDEERWTNGSNSDRRIAGGGTRPPKRRSVFVGLAMEERWKTARKLLKWQMAFDMFAFLLWGIEFFLILVGKRCPSGAFEGWCDSYNFATAFVSFAFVSFGFSVFFDIKDIHASRISPRTRA